MSGGNNNNGTATPKKFGLLELIIFVMAVVAGTACSICSKTMMELHGIGMTGQVEQFSKPLFQTFGMFVGMTFGLVMHWAVLTFKIPFPGYHIAIDSDTSKMEGAHATEKDVLLVGNGSTTTQEPVLPTWMYFFLAIPSIFDLLATVFCMCGLRYIDVSIYQMLRGSGIIFVALMKQHVLHDHLYKYQWAGVLFNVASVVFVGATAILSSSSSDDEDSSSKVNGGGTALLGVLLVMAGAFVQSLQYVFEEKVMNMDIPSPPLLLIGMEGLWGTLICIFIMYPLAYYLPGDDHGSYENFFNTMSMISNTKLLQVAFLVYFFAIFFYNLFAVLVTFLLDSVWHAILDNFRPITVWATDLYIYYVTDKTGNLGEPWTKWSFLQLIGMFILFYGTGVYNAPNAGSIELKGEWWAFGLDFTREYEEVEEEEMHAEWEARREDMKRRTTSSFYGERSPFISVHTQAMFGLGAQHN